MGQQPIKRYHIWRPDGTWAHEIGKIAAATKVTDEEIMDDFEQRKGQQEEYDEKQALAEKYLAEPEEEPDAPEEPDVGAENILSYQRRNKKKKKKDKPVIVNKKTKKKIKKAFRKFLYKRPKGKKAITWRPRLDRHPKPKTVKFFQGKKQPERRAIIRRR
jgi:hypothetical protein